MSHWWKPLGLKMTVVGRPDYRRIKAREDALAQLVPVWPEKAGRELTLDDVALRLGTRVKLGTEVVRDEVALRAFGWRHIRDAYDAPDAQEVIAEGVWRGFTRARALAWLWTFVQYPDTYSPSYAAEFRTYVERLTAGRLIEDARLASMARRYEADGTSPQEYRRALELVGERAFNHGLGLERARASRTS